MNDDTLKIGDIVELIDLTNEDKKHGKKIGTKAIYQGKLCRPDIDGVDWSIILIDGWGDYMVPTDNIRFIKAADIRSICKAFNIDEDEDFLKRLEEHCYGLEFMHDRSGVTIL